jgi:RHS repeat-associated protein
VLYDSSNSTTYTPGVSQNVNNVDSFFHSDWLGSTRYLTDSTGNTATAAPRYTAFGERSNALGLQPPSDYQFAGEWGYQTEWAASYEPGTGLRYLQQRYYDPAVGRFLSPDPISFFGGLNVYGYADNDPVMNLDPDGERWKQILGFIGGVGGGLLGAPEGGIGAVPGAALGGWEGQVAVSCRSAALERRRGCGEPEAAQARHSRQISAALLVGVGSVARPGSMGRLHQPSLRDWGLILRLPRHEGAVKVFGREGHSKESTALRGPRSAVWQTPRPI